MDNTFALVMTCAVGNRSLSSPHSPVPHAVSIPHARPPMKDRDRNRDADTRSPHNHRSACPSTVLMERAGEGMSGIWRSTVDQHEARHYHPLRKREQTEETDWFWLDCCTAEMLGFSGAPHTDPRLSRDTAAMYRRFVRVRASSDLRFRSADRRGPLLASSDILIDALLGTGLSSVVTGTYREAIELINSAGKPSSRLISRPVSHADTGAILGRADPRHVDHHMWPPKLGLYVGAGIDQAVQSACRYRIPPAYVEPSEPDPLLTDDSAFQSYRNACPPPIRERLAMREFLRGPWEKQAPRRWQPVRHSALEPAW